MLKVNNKAVIAKLRAAAIAPFEPECYDPMSDTTAGQNLVSQIDAMMYGDRGVYAAALDYVEGGGYYAWADDAREFLKDLLDETDAEAAQYDDGRVWALYCHLLARTIAQLYAENGGMR